MWDGVVTRVQCGGPPRRSRNLDERLVVRFPSVYRRQAALLQHLLSPGSRLRQGFLRRPVVSGRAAFRRHDFELMLVRYGPEVFDPDHALAQGAHLFHIRDGKVTRLVRYGDRERALADLGLEA